MQLHTQRCDKIETYMYLCELTREAGRLCRSWFTGRQHSDVALALVDSLQISFTRLVTIHTVRTLSLPADKSVRFRLKNYAKQKRQTIQTCFQSIAHPRNLDSA